MCSIDTENTSPTEIPIHMLNDIRGFCTNSEQETIDMILNFLNAFELYNSYTEVHQNESTGNESSRNESSGNESPLSLLKNFLSPEQKELFETYQAQFT